MKPLALNLLTAGVTLLLLVALALPARQVLRSPYEPAASVEDGPWPRPAQTPRRLFGVYIDPWHVDDWARAVGVAPQMVGKFEAFSLGQAPVDQLRQIERLGIRNVLISWEPWQPVPTSLGTEQQSRPQLGYRNIDIARGAQDRYVLAFAHELARFRGTVYLRYAHEMNGYWYPWSRDPAAYVAAWQRIVRLFESGGAHNVRFVWSVNPSIYDPIAAWKRTVQRYWPGRRYVDAVGSTMIDFGGVKSYPASRFAPRLRWLHEAYAKPVVLTEVNVAFEDRVPWLRGLRGMLATMPWIRALAWSQLPSRGKTHQSGTGVVDWDATTDPAAVVALRTIIEDGLR